MSCEQRVLLPTQLRPHTVSRGRSLRCVGIFIVVVDAHIARRNRSQHRSQLGCDLTLSTPHVWLQFVRRAHKIRLELPEDCLCRLPACSPPAECMGVRSASPELDPHLTPRMAQRIQNGQRCTRHGCGCVHQRTLPNTFSHTLSHTESSDDSLLERSLFLLFQAFLLLFFGPLLLLGGRQFVVTVQQRQSVRRNSSKHNSGKKN